MTKVLEVELDLDLNDDDMAIYARYVLEGLTEHQAAQQVAQDILGASGCIVQSATLVDF